MLHLETIYPDTLDLLKRLMAREELAPFALAGGTSLALHLGHRISVDLDFFGKHDFDAEELLALYAELGSFHLLNQSKSLLIVSLNGVKVDVINYRYAPLRPILEWEGIRLMGLADIAAMKLAAIAGRGRMRDFIDLYFLLQHFSLLEMMGFYNEKFSDGSEFLIAKSLTYFADAESDEPPRMLVATDWEEVKTTIRREVGKRYR